MSRGKRGPSLQIGTTTRSASLTPCDLIALAESTHAVYVQELIFTGVECEPEESDYTNPADRRTVKNHAEAKYWLRGIRKSTNAAKDLSPSERADYMRRHHESWEAKVERRVNPGRDPASSDTVPVADRLGVLPSSEQERSRTRAICRVEPRWIYASRLSSSI
jgi:hypothetical protein